MSVKTGKLVHTFSGHFEEVSGLAILRRQGPQGRETLVVSVSIDGTIRKWPLPPPSTTLQEGADETGEDEEMDQPQKPAAPEEGRDHPEPGPGPAMTEEEERELAELMMDE